MGMTVGLNVVVLYGRGETGVQARVSLNTGMLLTGPPPRPAVIAGGRSPTALGAFSALCSLTLCFVSHQDLCIEHPGAFPMVPWPGTK